MLQVPAALLGGVGEHGVSELEQGTGVLPRLSDDSHDQHQSSLNVDLGHVAQHLLVLVLVPSLPLHEHRQEFRGYDNVRGILPAVPVSPR